MRQGLLAVLAVALYGCGGGGGGSSTPPDSYGLPTVGHYRGTYHLAGSDAAIGEAYVQVNPTTSEFMQLSPYSGPGDTSSALSSTFVIHPDGTIGGTVDEGGESGTLTGNINSKNDTVVTAAVHAVFPSREIHAILTATRE